MGEFRKHIEEAIVVNLKRMPRYALQTWGYSLPISLGLIFFEICIWPVALYYDWKAKKWYRDDLRIMLDDFISMDKINSWNYEYPVDRRPKKFHFKIGLYKMRLELASLLFKHEWDEADNYFNHYRDQLEEKSHYQLYLYKHFLESIHRSLRLTRLWHDRETLPKQLLDYRRGFLLIQTLGLEYCLLLDFWAYPLYKRGIGIIKNDIPHIPVPESL